MTGYTTPWNLPKETSADVVSLSTDFAALATNANQALNDLKSQSMGAPTLANGLDLNAAQDVGAFIALGSDTHANTPEPGTGIIRNYAVPTGNVYQTWQGYATRSLWARYMSSISGWVSWVRLDSAGYVWADLTTADTLDSILTAGTYRVPTTTVATAVGFPEVTVGGLTVSDSGYTGTNRIIEQRAWSYVRQGFWLRTRQSSGAFTPWVFFGPVDAPQQRRVYSQAAFRSRRGGRIGTGGRAAVALRFDHHTQTFASKVLPLLKQYGLPWSLALNPTKVGTGDDTMTYAQMQAEAIGSGGEVWNHGGNHADRTTDYQIRSEIVGALGTLRTNFPRLPIEAFQLPGVGGTGYLGLLDGSTEDMWGTYAGSLVTQFHATASGQSGGVYRPLTGEIGWGQNHYTIGGQTDTTVKGVINGAVSAGAGLVLMLHPSDLDDTGNMTTAQLGSVLSYLAQLRDAGSLVVLTQTGLALADRGTDERHNLFPGLLTGTHGWTGWTVTSGVATGSSTPMTRAIDLSRQAHMCGGTRDLVVYARASTARTLTITTADTNGTVATTHPIAGTGAWVRVSRPYTIPLDDTAPTVSITSSGSTDIVRIDALAL